MSTDICARGDRFRGLVDEGGRRRRFLVGANLFVRKEGRETRAFVGQRERASYTIIATPTTTQKMQNFVSIWETEQKMLGYSKCEKNPSSQYLYQQCWSVSVQALHFFEILRWNIFSFHFDRHHTNANNL
jgi:hypothetical protein